MKLNIVPARKGFEWAQLGIRTFLRQPLALSALFFMYMAAIILVAQIPVVGPMVSTLLVPAATLGLMVASEQASRGSFPLPSVLVTAFRTGRQRARSMLVLGAIYTVGSTLATTLASLLVGAPPPNEAGGEIPPVTLLALLFHVPLFIMFWHAPALVHWHAVTPAKSLFFSVVACLRNLRAFAVYGFTWAVLFVAAALVFGWIAGLFGGPALARGVMTPVALLMAAMSTTSIYFSFRDSFVADETPAAVPPGEEHRP